jgi:hydantoinase/oxoprolinase-like protein
LDISQLKMEKRLDLKLQNDVDPITLEVINHGLISIPNQIDANIKRTAFSTYVYEYNDFAVGLTDAKAACCRLWRIQLALLCVMGCGSMAPTGFSMVTRCSVIMQRCKDSVLIIPSCTRRSEPVAVITV